MKLYGVEKSESDTRTVSTLMREIYLDYYSKSLQPENDKSKWAYSKRLNEEAKDHEMKL